MLPHHPTDPAFSFLSALRLPVRRLVDYIKARYLTTLPIPVAGIIQVNQEMHAVLSGFLTMIRAVVDRIGKGQRWSNDLFQDGPLLASIFFDIEVNFVSVIFYLRLFRLGRFLFGGCCVALLESLGFCLIQQEKGRTTKFILATSGKRYCVGSPRYCHSQSR